MAIKITFDSFLAVLKRSSLLSEEQLNALLEKFRAANGNTSEGKPFAEFLVRQKILTVWQAEKLLQGKHKGFFLGRYRLLSLLGKGGMSSVYLAEHTVMKRRCALKVLPAKRVSDASYLGRFHREAQAVASLDHPNIVRAYDVDMTTDGGVDIHFLSMEFVQGKSLLEIVQAHGPVSAREAAEYVRQSARGLEHAHHAGLVHRDIKPGNLLLSPEGIIKVLDLGLARFFNEEEGSLTVEHDEKVLGTADYISPEQAIDSHTVDHRTDIYSLGCTLYFLLSGHPPYNTGALHQRLIAHQTKPVPPLPPERTDIPESLVAIMHKMMAKKVEDRYASAAQVAETLAAWLADTSTAETSIAGAIPPAIAKVPAATVLATAAKPLPSKPASAVSPVSAENQRSSGKSGPLVPSVALTNNMVSAAIDSVNDAAETRVTDDSEDPLGNFLAHLSHPEFNLTAPRKPSPGDSTRTKALSARSSSKRLSQAANDTDTTQGEKTAVVPAKSVSVSIESASDLPLDLFDLNLDLGESPSAMIVDPLEAITSQGIETSHSEPASFPAMASPSTVSRAAVNRSPGPALSPQRLWIIGGGLVIVAGLVAWMLIPPSNSPPKVTANASRLRAAPTVTTEMIIVGPEGHFLTIREAVAFLHQNFRPLSASESRTIQVTGGYTYPEVLSFSAESRGLIKIQSTGPIPAVIQGDGRSPVLRLQDAPGITLEGIDLDAAGADTAIGVTGFCPSSRLTGLKIRNFKKTGVVLKSVAANADEEFVFERSTLTTSEPGGLAIQWTADPGVSTAYVTLKELRILGAFNCGLELSGDLWKSTLQGNVLSGAGVGMRFRPGLIEGFTMIGNTFVKNDRGIEFLQAPANDSKGWLCTQNIFTGNRAADTTLATGDARKLVEQFLAGVETRQGNRTDRASVTGVDLFTGAGQVGAKLQFVSEDPLSADYMKLKTP